MTGVPGVTLNNGTTIPQLGFGVWQVPDEEAVQAVGTALEAGYRGIDTAAAYDNERGVGRAVAASGVPRDGLFVTTKLWNGGDRTWSGPQGRDAVLRAFDASLSRLGLDHVDLYLIHWPAPAADSFPDIWRVFEELCAQGRTRGIGVSNFRHEDLMRLLKETDTVPAVNQIECHPYLPQHALRRFHAEHGIATQAWSPLAQGGPLLADPKVAAVAARHGRSPAQVVLRWHVQLGTVVIPKSVTPRRIAENIDVFDFALDADDMDALATLETGERTGPDPATFQP